MAAEGIKTPSFIGENKRGSKYVTHHGETAENLYLSPDEAVIFKSERVSEQNGV